MREKKADSKRAKEGDVSFEATMRNGETEGLYSQVLTAESMLDEDGIH